MGLKDYIHKKELAFRRKATDEANNKSSVEQKIVDDEIRELRKSAVRHYKKLVKQLNAVDAEFELHKTNPRDPEDFEYEMIIDVGDLLTNYSVNIDFDDETQEAILNLKKSDCKKISKARVPYHNFLEIASLEDIIEKLLMEIDGACKDPI